MTSAPFSRGRGSERSRSVSERCDFEVAPVKVGEVTVGMVTRAIDLYHRVAYAGLSVYKAPDLGDDPGFPITMFLDPAHSVEQDGQRR